MLSDRQIAKKLDMSYDTLLRWKKDKSSLYNHIKEGFELKQFVLNLDESLGIIYRQTQLMRLKDKIEEGTDNLCKVRYANLTPSEKEFFEDKPFIWLKTIRSYSFNVLAYKDELEILDDGNYYMDISEYVTDGCEDGSEWLISNFMSLENTNTFFEWYLSTSS